MGKGSVMFAQVALVSQTKMIALDELNVVAAALQKQVVRDFGPIWSVHASVSAFGQLNQIPLGSWAIVVRDDIKEPGAAGYHSNRKNGQPFALVQYEKNWTLTASHECLEMLADPYGNRTVASNSLKQGQGRVLYLVEVCDPSEDAKYAYSADGVLVSDFYTPNFFDPKAASGVRYSFTGDIRGPRKVLDGGYISWWDPTSKHLFQAFVEGTKSQIVDQGLVPDGLSLREHSDRKSEKRRSKVIRSGVPKGLLQTAMVRNIAGAPASGKSAVDESAHAYATDLESQIRLLMKR
jgi:hypothetical protein